MDFRGAPRPDANASLFRFAPVSTRRFTSGLHSRLTHSFDTEVMRPDHPKCSAVGKSFLETSVTCAAGSYTANLILK